MKFSNWHISVTGELKHSNLISRTKRFEVIYLDDHRIFRQGIENYCINPFFNNIDLNQLTNGDDAYEHLKQKITNGEKIDLFITDINHPGLSGNGC